MEIVKHPFFHGKELESSNWNNRPLTRGCLGFQVSVSSTAPPGVPTHSRGPSTKAQREVPIPDVVMDKYAKYWRRPQPAVFFLRKKQQRLGGTSLGSPRIVVNGVILGQTFATVDLTTNPRLNKALFLGGCTFVLVD